MIIDDIRDLNCDIIARTSQAGFQILSWMHDNINVLVLDHDLGDHSHMDGNRLLKELIVHKLLPQEVQLCSDNPVGRQNMRAQLEDIGYATKDGRIYVRDN